MRADLETVNTGVEREHDFHKHPLEDLMNEIAEEKPIPTLTARLACRDEFTPILKETGEGMQAVKCLMQEIKGLLATNPAPAPEVLAVVTALAQTIDDRLAAIAQVIIDNLAKIAIFPDPEFESQEPIIS